MAFFYLQNEAASMIEKGKIVLISQSQGRGSKPEYYEAGAATTTLLRSIEVLMLQNRAA
jgi:hypothetical protein